MSDARHEHLPESTLDEQVGPAKRYEVAWYSLPKLPDLGPHQGRTAVWWNVYGPLLRKAPLTTPQT